MEINKIKEFIQLMKESNLKVLSIDDGDVEVYLEEHSQEVTQQMPIQTNTTTPQVAPESIDTKSNLIDIRAKQIGVFYTQPDQDSKETFVNIGDKVNNGDQIGLIETMKIFTEVLIEDSGIIEEILVQNGEPVEFDQVIMRLRAEEA